MIKQKKFHQRVRGLLLAAVALLSATPQSGQAQSLTVIPFNQTWSYNQTNTDLLTAWREPGYDASGWPTGVGPLGFGAAEPLTGGVLGDTGLSIQTVLSRFMQPPDGALQVRTYYFQTKFVFTNDPVGVTLVSSNLIDDAAVYFLNGVEIGRVAFPPPPAVITHASEGTRAATDVTTSGWDVFTNVPSNLIQGTNVLAVEVHQTGGASSDLAFAHKLIAIIPAPVAITAQPTNQTVAENRVVNITVGVSGTPTPTFQWYKDLSAILDATNQTFTIANSATTDTGDYFVVASNALNVVTSTVARLTVVVDTNGPVLLSIKTDETFQKITITWDEQIAQGPAIEAGNYTIHDSASNVVSASAVDFRGNSVVLHVPTLQAGTNYAIEINFQQDLVGNLTPPMGMPTIDPDNGVVSNFYTWVFTRGFTRFQAYLGLPVGQSIAQFVAMPVYPDAPTFGFYTNVLYWPQTVTPNVDQYAMRFSGLFEAPENGVYLFNPDNDDEVRLRIFPSEDPSGIPAELVGTTVTGLGDGPTLDVTLVAGQRYYYELIVREFGGGDHAGLAVTLPSAVVVSPLRAQYLVIAADPLAASNAGISQQPLNITIAQNHTATFSVTATNVGGGASYQWQISTGGPFSDIAGANSPTYITPLRSLTDSGHQYRVLVTVPGRSLVSEVVTLTVINDTFPPHITAVRGSRNLNTVTVVFDEVMDPGTVGETSNYELRDSANAVLELTLPVLSGDNRSVTFTTPAQTPGAAYTLRAQDVTDLVGNPLATTNITFQAWVLSRGFAYFEAYDTGGGNEVSILTAHPSYPNNPRDVAFIPTFDSRNAYPNDTHEAYGARLSGYFTATATTNYIFYFSADDGSELWMSTDSNPANKVLLRATSTCCTANSVNPATNALVAGQTYYMELLYKEGTGGDYGRVVVKTAGDPANPDNLTPISGQFLSTLADPTGASITITQQPSSLAINPGLAATFSVRATGMITTGTAPVAYQWQRQIAGIFTDIAGANSANYVTGILGVPDNGSQYRALVFVPGATATSVVATVTVGSTPTGPTLRSAYSGGVLVLSWDAPARLQCATSLTPPVNWQDVTTNGVTSYSVNPLNQFNVTLDTAQSGGGLRTGSGSGTITVLGNVLTVDVTYSGLSGNRTDGHFHAPALRGANAGVVYDLVGITTGSQSGTIKGTVTLLDPGYGGRSAAAQIQDMRNQLWYLNIHTSTFGGGEIRGQVEPGGARFYRLISP